MGTHDPPDGPDPNAATPADWEWAAYAVMLAILMFRIILR